MVGKLVKFIIELIVVAFIVGWLLVTLPLQNVALSELF
jgi:hypothetical protein